MVLRVSPFCPPFRWVSSETLGRRAPPSGVTTPSHWWRVGGTASVNSALPPTRYAKHGQVDDAARANRPLPPTRSRRRALHEKIPAMPTYEYACTSCGERTEARQG